MAVDRVEYHIHDRSIRSLRMESGKASCTVKFSVQKTPIRCISCRNQRGELRLECERCMRFANVVHGVTIIHSVDYSMIGTRWAFLYRKLYCTSCERFVAKREAAHFQCKHRPLSGGGGSFRDKEGMDINSGADYISL